MPCVGEKKLFDEEPLTGAALATQIGKKNANNQCQ
jgi:hypothetical protein